MDGLSSHLMSSDCPFCHKPMVGHIFQCPNGHHMCRDCHTSARKHDGVCVCVCVCMCVMSERVLCLSLCQCFACNTRPRRKARRLTSTRLPDQASVAGPIAKWRLGRSAAGWPRCFETGALQRLSEWMPTKHHPVPRRKLQTLALPQLQTCGGSRRQRRTALT